MLKMNEKNIPDYSMAKLLNSKKFREFHLNSTCRLFRFKDTDEYFKSIGIHASHIENLDIPMMMIHSKDDPIVSVDNLPMDKLLKNKNIIIAKTEKGSHVCWFSGLKPYRVSKQKKP